MDSIKRVPFLKKEENQRYRLTTFYLQICYIDESYTDSTVFPLFPTAWPFPEFCESLQGTYF